MEEKKPHEEAWDILMEVSDLLHEEEDAKGDIKPTGEGRALAKMKAALEREIAWDATDFLKQHGFTGRGERSKPPKQRRRG